MERKTFHRAKEREPTLPMTCAGHRLNFWILILTGILAFLDEELINDRAQSGSNDIVTFTISSTLYMNKIKRKVPLTFHLNLGTPLPMSNSGHRNHRIWSWQPSRSPTGTHLSGGRPHPRKTRFDRADLPTDKTSSTMDLFLGTNYDGEILG